MDLSLEWVKWLPDDVVLLEGRTVQELEYHHETLDSLMELVAGSLAVHFVDQAHGQKQVVQQLQGLVNVLVILKTAEVLQQKIQLILLE